MPKKSEIEPKCLIDSRTLHARARVGEEEGDDREQDAGGHGDLQTKAQDVPHVRRR
ncbi:hypothetical protein DVH05_010107 [Phytophthora capsici]|nr:hypothetical protein DVH05_022005 [Phytophthora capsici]KAG1702318.1 hypothetical protein DVH05_010107 [Phytophthora capsici]